MRSGRMTNEQHDYLWMLAKGEKLPDEAGALYKAIEARLATPPPSNKLRDMKDAPRDGEPFLAQWQSGEWEVPKYSPEYEEDPWRVFGSSYPDEAFRGWLPLPEVSE